MLTHKPIFSKKWFFIIPIILIGGLALISVIPRDIPCATVILFNHKCVFCGATRAFEFFHTLNWITSITFNPFIFIVLLFLWSLSILYFISFLNLFFKKFFHQIFVFLNQNFFMVFSFFIILYLSQYLLRIIFN